ncbi:MAG: hypothetical protein UU47_C0016G0010 [candidate division TM6 bacterium GW2011_GWE2_41_16]|nr:MAG: hypothetical protein UU47_C0016G0010 [candidate division TM6 bacterium GW2011_GWE2_41_16]
MKYFIYVLTVLIPVTACVQPLEATSWKRIIISAGTVATGAGSAAAYLIKKSHDRAAKAALGIHASDIKFLSRMAHGAVSVIKHHSFPYVVTIGALAGVGIMLYRKNRMHTKVIQDFQQQESTSGERIRALQTSEQSMKTKLNSWQRILTDKIHELSTLENAQDTLQRQLLSVQTDVINLQNQNHSLQERLQQQASSQCQQEAEPVASVSVQATEGSEKNAEQSTSHSQQQQFNDENRVLKILLDEQNMRYQDLQKRAQLRNKAVQESMQKIAQTAWAHREEREALQRDVLGLQKEKNQLQAQHILDQENILFKNVLEAVRNEELCQQDQDIATISHAHWLHHAGMVFEQEHLLAQLVETRYAYDVLKKDAESLSVMRAEDVKTHEAMLAQLSQIMGQLQLRIEDGKRRLTFAQQRENALKQTHPEAYNAIVAMQKRDWTTLQQQTQTN